MNKVKFLCILTLIVGCGSNRYLGKYETIENGGYRLNVNLHDTSKFTYFVSTDLGGQASLEGNWKVIKDTIFLDVRSPLDIKLIEENRTFFVERHLDTIPVGKKYFRLLDHLENPAQIATVVVYDTIRLGFPNSDGEVFDFIKEIKKIEILVDGAKIGPFAIENDRSNYFDFRIFHKNLLPYLHGNYINKWYHKRGKLFPILNGDSINWNWGLVRSKR